MSDPCGTRDKILGVARSQFARNGYHGTSMDAIVKDTGLSKGALYWHFDGKSDLFAAVLRREVEKIIHSHVEALRGNEEDVRSFVTLQGEWIIDMLWEDREMCLLFITLFIERLRGGQEGRELSDIAGDLLGIIQDKLWPVTQEVFPAFRSGEARGDYKRILTTLRFVMHGIIMELGFNLDLDSARELWRFAIGRFDFPSEGFK